MLIEKLLEKVQQDQATVCVVGLGYVGLPLAQAFASRLNVIGFDIDREKVRSLEQAGARAGSGSRISFTDDAREIAKADFVIICVPTPVTRSREPDLTYVKKATETIARNMKQGAVVILESTVYPGVTEDLLKPLLEEHSGLKCGADFALAYSPERINPGDTVHTLSKITKIVSASDEKTTDLLAALYQKVIERVFKAKNIKTAEAAKVIENIQRDLDIALVNEFAIIFHKLGLNTRDVLDAASTKWNFHRYQPGMVGGYCIPVNPYYLVHRAKEAGYYPQVILAGRAMNEYMPKYVAEMAVKALIQAGKPIKNSKVLIMGLTYKEDATDTRESPVTAMIKELKEYGINVLGFDPMVEGDPGRELGIAMFDPDNAAGAAQPASRVDCIILSVAHAAFKKFTLARLKEIQTAEPVLIDVRGAYDAEQARNMGFHYRTL